MPSPETKADFVTWHIDPAHPSASAMVEPTLTVDVPAEFPRIDERFMTQEYDYTWLNVFIPEKSDGSKNIFHGLNGLAMHRNQTGKTEWFYAGDESNVQEPVFIPRTKDAPEGDGWVMALVERHGQTQHCDVVVIDTKGFANPIAIVQLPFHMKAQVHGNWIGSDVLGGYKSVVREWPEVQVSGKGALEPL